MPAPLPTLTLLATRRHRSTVDPARCVEVDRRGRGAVAARGQAGSVRRAEPGPAGPLLLEAARQDAGIEVSVWGSPRTPADAVERALAAAAAWAGAGDDAAPLRDLASRSPVVSRLLREVGDVHLSALPRVGEALGRAILGQLVQSEEARRSMVQFAALAGTPANGLWTWPTGSQVATTPAWAMRRCGISLRGARALHAGALADARLEAARGDWPLLERRLRALPGVGAWTSGMARLALGDPDAVAVGDYHLPALVGAALGDGPTDDPGMLDLLAPFAGQRGRVIRLVVRGYARGRIAAPRRRAPHAALSAHRYW